MPVSLEPSPLKNPPAVMSPVVSMAAVESLLLAKVRSEAPEAAPLSLKIICVFVPATGPAGPCGPAGP